MCGCAQVHCADVRDFRVIADSSRVPGLRSNSNGLLLQLTCTDEVGAAVEVEARTVYGLAFISNSCAGNRVQLLEACKRR